MLAAERGRRYAAGVTLAFATLAKFFPLVLAPALWRPWDWRMPLSMMVAGALLYFLYFPYLSADSRLFGFLGGYADEGGLKTGEGFLLSALFREVGLGEAALPLFGLCALGLLAALALRTLFRADAERIDIPGAFAIAMSFTLLISPPRERGGSIGADVGADDAARVGGKHGQDTDRPAARGVVRFPRLHGRSLLRQGWAPIYRHLAFEEVGEELAPTHPRTDIAAVVRR